MKKLGDAGRRLEAKEVTGVPLASAIGLTAASISRILDGASRPRQVTSNRLMNRRGGTLGEGQSLLRPPSSRLTGLPEPSVIEDAGHRREEIARCDRFLAIKTQPISPKNPLARELDCKFTVHRAPEQTRLTAGMFRDWLQRERVFVVVPFLQEADRGLLSENLELVEVGDLSDVLLTILRNR